MNNEIIETLLSHHAYILHFAESKCRCNEDAEDLVSETYLAALAYIRKGGSIEYPKTWLANTFMHKYNDTLRRRYRMPAVVNFDALGDFDGGEDLFADDDDEAADLRRRVLYLTRTTREVLIRHYFGGEDVRSIARSLDIPEGIRLIDKFIDFQFKYIERVFDAVGDKIDVLWMGEDLGTQIGPLISMDMFKKHILPRHKPFFDLAASYGVPCMLHTCGSSSWTYEEYIKAGLRAVDTLQPEATDRSPRYLKDTCGGRLAFHGCISTAGALTYGTEEEAEKDAKETISIMKPGGGYSFAPTHRLQDNTPIENALAVYRADMEYGKY